MTTLVKNNKEFELSYHAIERIEERFRSLTEKQIADAFQRAKMLTTQNAMKFGQTYAKRVFNKEIYQPNEKLLVNPYYDMTFVIDPNNGTVITIYSYSNGNEI